MSAIPSVERSVSSSTRRFRPWPGPFKHWKSDVAPEIRRLLCLYPIVCHSDSVRRITDHRSQHTHRVLHDPVVRLQPSILVHSLLAYSNRLFRLGSWDSMIPVS